MTQHTRDYRFLGDGARSRREPRRQNGSRVASTKSVVRLDQHRHAFPETKRLAVINSDSLLAGTGGFVR